jgi:hypothetical protein
MFTFNGRDAHRALVPAKVHLPFQRQIGDILPEKTKSDDDVVRWHYYIAVPISCLFRLILPSFAFLRLVFVERGRGPIPCLHVLSLI